MLETHCEFYIQWDLQGKADGLKERFESHRLVCCIVSGISRILILLEGCVDRQVVC